MDKYDDDKVKANKPLMELIALSSKQNHLFNDMLRATKYDIADLSTVIYQKKYNADDANYNEFEELNQLNDEYKTKFDALSEHEDVDEDELESLIDFYTD